MKKKKERLKRRSITLNTLLRITSQPAIGQNKIPVSFSFKKDDFFFFRKASLGLNYSCQVFFKDIAFFLSHSPNLFASYLLTVLIVLFHNFLFLSYPIYIYSLILPQAISIVSPTLLLPLLLSESIFPVNSRFSKPYFVSSFPTTITVIAKAWPENYDMTQYK